MADVSAGKRDDAMKLAKSLAEKNPKDMTARETYTLLCWSRPA